MASINLRAVSFVVFLFAWFGTAYRLPHGKWNRKEVGEDVGNTKSDGDEPVEAATTGGGKSSSDIFAQREQLKNKEGAKPLVGEVHGAVMERDSEIGRVDFTGTDASVESLKEGKKDMDEKKTDRLRVEDMVKDFLETQTTDRVEDMVKEKETEKEREEVREFKKFFPRKEDGVIKKDIKKIFKKGKISTSDPLLTNLKNHIREWHDARKKKEWKVFEVLSWEEELLVKIKGWIGMEMEVPLVPVDDDRETADVLWVEAKKIIKELKKELKESKN